MRKMFLRAWSLPFRIASGTSLALPRPTPTCPDSSPTTTRAEKLKRRPPFTTLATRLMWMTRSLSFSSSMLSKGMKTSLELEPGFACCVGEGFDAPVVKVAVAVEDDLLDLALEADLGNERADLLGRVGLVVVVERAFEVARERGGGGERLAVAVVHDLRVEVPAAPEHAEARALRIAADLAADTQLATLSTDELRSHGYPTWPSPWQPYPLCGGSIPRGSGFPYRRTVPADGAPGWSRPSGRAGPCPES